MSYSYNVENKEIGEFEKRRVGDESKTTEARIVVGTVYRVPFRTSHPCSDDRRIYRSDNFLIDALAREACDAESRSEGEQTRNTTSIQRTKSTFDNFIGARISVHDASRSESVANRDDRSRNEFLCRYFVETRYSI